MVSPSPSLSPTPTPTTPAPIPAVLEPVSHYRSPVRKPEPLDRTTVRFGIVLMMLGISTVGRATRVRRATG
jgi:hypothetical protein